MSSKHESPSTDGITADIYEVVRDVIGDKVTEMFNCATIREKIWRARPISFGASQYEPFAIFSASFSTELNAVGTSIEKPTSLIVCDYLKILLVSGKT